MDRDEMVSRLDFMSRYFDARGGMVVGDGKLLLLACANAAREAAALVKAQIPRVMTLDEVVEHFSLPPVFTDDPDAQEDYYEDIQPLYFEYPDQEARPWAIHWRGSAQSQRYVDERRDTYNRKWRCWTARPTREQLEEAEWDD